MRRKMVNYIKNVLLTMVNLFVLTLTIALPIVVAMKFIHWIFP